VTSWAITYAEADFGVTAGGEPVQRWTIDDGELSLSVLSLGGIIQALEVPGSDGTRADVMLGFDDVAGYETSKTFAGALIGRLANRLTRARFTLAGTEYQIVPNEGETALHGGLDGFHRRIWAIDKYADDEGAGLRLQLVSPDGDQGFPGRLQVTVDYLLVPGQRTLKIRYAARTDQTTVLNLTQHAYFNLSGALQPSPSLDGQLLQVNAAHYTPVDGRGLPSGEVAHVVGTSFDLRTPQSLDFLSLDHNLVIDDPEPVETGHGHGHGHGTTLTPAAVLEHPASGRRLEVLTTEPGIQIYTGSGLDGSEVGKGGVRYQRSAAICLETQHFPDAPNHPEFPTTTLHPGEEFLSITEWRFSS
jgi:aldose 1-epimerase